MHCAVSNVSEFRQILPSGGSWDVETIAALLASGLFQGIQGRSTACSHQAVVHMTLHNLNLKMSMSTLDIRYTLYIYISFISEESLHLNLSSPALWTLRRSLQETWLRKAGLQHRIFNSTSVHMFVWNHLASHWCYHPPRETPLLPQGDHNAFREWGNPSDLSIGAVQREICEQCFKVCESRWKKINWTHIKVNLVFFVSCNLHLLSESYSGHTVCPAFGMAMWWTRRNRGPRQKT